MSKAIAETWGEWIIKRARFVGLGKNQLADATGSAAQTVTRWAKMAEAPDRMRGGKGENLARALRTDYGTLFSRWRTVEPEAAPLTAMGSLISADESDALRRKIGAVAELLPEDKLRDLFNTGESLLRHSHAAVA